MSEFIPTGGSKWIDPRKFYLNKYTSNISKGCLLNVDLEYSMELRKLHNDYLLASDKIKVKEKRLSKYQLFIADFDSIPIGNIKNSVPNFFHREKYVLHYENLQLYLRLELKLKKIIAYYDLISCNG